jgi:putative flippase GtrA
VAFVLMRAFVFSAQERAMGPQVLKFAAVNLVALAQTLLISILLARWALPALGMAASLARSVGHLAGVTAPVVTSYFAHRMITFK